MALRQSFPMFLNWFRILMQIGKSEPTVVLACSSIRNSLSAMSSFTDTLARPPWL